MIHLHYSKGPHIVSMCRCSSELSRVQRRAAKWYRPHSHSSTRVVSASSKVSFRSCSPTGLSCRRAQRCPPRSARSCCSSLSSLRRAYQRARRVTQTTYKSYDSQLKDLKLWDNFKSVQNFSGKWLYSIWGSFCDHLATTPMGVWISTIAQSQKQSRRCCYLMNKCWNNGVVDWQTISSKAGMHPSIYNSTRKIIG